MVTMADKDAIKDFFINPPSPETTEKVHDALFNPPDPSTVETVHDLLTKPPTEDMITNVNGRLEHFITDDLVQNFTSYFFIRLMFWKKSYHISPLFFFLKYNNRIINCRNCILWYYANYEQK